MSYLPICPESILMSLSYDRDTGLFIRTNHRIKNLVGKVAGFKDRLGYIVIDVGGVSYLAHRLAWAIEKGSMPTTMVIDHINGNPTDNRISNLRVGAQAQNAQNIRAAHTDSMSGVIGVSYNKINRSYVSRICIDGKNKTKSFQTMKEAHDHYLEQKRKFHEFSTI